MKNREWLLGDTRVDELYEYKNLGVLKNYVGSFSSNVEDNINKTREESCLVFVSDFDLCKVNPLIYVKLWKQACLPSLLFVVELWTLSPTLLLMSDVSTGFSNIFCVPEFARGLLLLKLLSLNSIQSKVATKKVLLLGRMIT